LQYYDIKIIPTKFFNIFFNFNVPKKSPIFEFQKIIKMASITLGGNAINTNGNLPEIGLKAPNFQLVKNDLSVASLSDFAGSKVVLNIFPSIDTPTCATSVRTFNADASKLENTKVLCISRDLPFAQKRFCGAEGLENVINLSDFKTGQFGKDYGLEIVDSVLAGLHSRVVIVLDENGVVKYTEQVPEIADEPNYEAALATI
jgi:thioredoxin-dependent peroxiredoxin